MIRLDRIGDVLLSTPAIKAVREACPESYIAFMVRPYAFDVVKGNPYLNEVIVYDKKGSEKGIIGNLRLSARLRKKRFDLAIVLHPTQRSHIIAYLAGIQHRLGYDRKMGFLLTKRVPHTKQLGLKHEIDYTLGLLRYIGIESCDKALYIPLSDECERRVNTLFAQNGITNEDLVVTVNAGASCPSKRWPPEMYGQVCDNLSNEFNAKIVLISDKKDKVFADKVALMMGRPSVNLSDMTSIGDLASILRRTRLFISNDSGPVHIACAVGTPVISIFGRSNRGLTPARWGPSGSRDVVLHKDVGCEVCLAHNCKLGFKCLKAITVKDVLEAAKKILTPR